MIFTLPTTVSPSSKMGGSLQGGVTDNDGLSTGATITAPTGSALYTAIIDGVIQQTLHADPFSYTESNDFQSSNSLRRAGEPRSRARPAPPSVRTSASSSISSSRATSRRR